MPNYKVQQGDCILSIAQQFGLRWQTIWEHPNNADLKRSRKQDPNILFPGDVVYVPDREPRYEMKATDQRHRFVRKTPRALVRMRLLDWKGEPRSSVKYTASVDGIRFDGSTDASGYISVRVPPDARHMIINLLDGSEEQYGVQLGCLDPVDTISGIRQRLSNLGYSSSSDSNVAEATRVALWAFQREMQLPETGEADDDACQQLKRLHGC